MARRRDVRPVPEGPGKRGARVGEVLPGQRRSREQRYAGHHRRRAGPLRPPPAASRLHEDGREAAGEARRAKQAEPTSQGRAKKPSRRRPSPQKAEPKQPEQKSGQDGPTPVAKPRPASAAAEPATGTTSPVAEGPAARRAGRRQRRADATPCSAAPRPAPRRTWTPRWTVPTATSVRTRAGQAAVGQPHRHQQPPRPRPRRQGVVHPPDRLRADQGAQGDAGDERRLRHRRRQAQPGHSRRTSTSASPSTCRSRTAPASCWCRRSRPPRRWTSRRSGRRTRTSSARPATTSSRSRTSRAPPSR